MKKTLIKLHQELVNNGELEVARKLLKFLISGAIKLYFCDTDWKLDNLLSKLGFKPYIDNRGYATYRLGRI